MRTKRKSGNLGKLVIKRNFLKENKMLFKLELLTTIQVSKYLSQKGFEDIAGIFQREKLDGASLVILLASREGIKIMEEELCLSPQQIENLKSLYTCIYNLRKIYFGNIDESERPFY
eukprot:TRINITY_DN7177_c0_g1_i1.p1 TRINITY_DN7177_c0_g1~~TRINITY_DN7177_c0_g1_i1.p1  ORF type:complete len:117 (+),score=17.04 TRINITY_DN7177_c0_g1_i1:343-693(+)